MPFDEETRQFYAENAALYANRERGGPDAMLTGFLDHLPKGGKVLELGCGAGQDAAAMLARGFDVEPTDGSPELAAEAERRLKRPVRVMLFDDLAAEAAYDGVWACASLLHVPLGDLPVILRRVHRALRPGGWFVASYKAGAGEGRDKFARFYSYPARAGLLAAYENAAHWAALGCDDATGAGFDRQAIDWLWVTAQK